MPGIGKEKPGKAREQRKGEIEKLRGDQGLVVRR
jgi:hypothetical protein